LKISGNIALGGNRKEINKNKEKMQEIEENQLNSSQIKQNKHYFKWGAG